MALSNQKTALFFRLSISVTVFSALFNFMPSFLIILGAFGMILFLGIHLFQKEKRTLLDYARLFLILAFSSNFILSLFASPLSQALTLMTKLSLVLFLILYIKDIVILFQDIAQNSSALLHNFAKEGLSYILADMATVYIVIASLFKILNWKLGILNGDTLLIIGLFAALISIFTSSRITEK